MTRTSADPLTDAVEMGARMLAGTELFGRIRDRDVTIANSPKELVWQQNKVSLYRFLPPVERQVHIPVLITYGLVGRWTMTDLQEDRSLVRNLLNLGVDLYVVDCGNPTRADQFLTLDDYICGYLGDCVREVARHAQVPRINLLGVCEGGVFTTCSRRCSRRASTP